MDLLPGMLRRKKAETGSVPLQHYFPIPLSGYSGDSAVYFSVRKAETIIFFIHGYDGHVTDTWADFIGIFHELPEAKLADIIYLSYDFRSSPHLSAAVLYAAIKRIMISKNMPTPPGLTRKSSQYKNILFVSHSLGGILSRLIVIDAIKENQPWSKLVKQIMFAPAHCGARFQKLFCRNDEPATWLKIFFYRKPVLEDLMPGSDFLVDFLELAESHLQSHSEITATAVIHGSGDHVIAVGRFLNDPIPIVFQKKHENVCKPNTKFRDPAKIVGEYV